VIGATDNAAVRKVVTETRPGRSVAERFVAGDTLEEAVAATASLNASGKQVSLDLLGEAVRDQDMAIAAADEYVAAIGAIAEHDLAANVSIKLTQLGLEFDEKLATENLDRLASAAARIGSTVTIDMEDSRFTESTVELYAAAQGKHGNLGLCVQAYLRRTAADLDRLIPLGGHIRLCKGAYVEGPEIAFTDREAVENSYISLLEMLMHAEQVRPCIATHDDTLIERAASLADERSGPWEYQMLYGVRPNRHDELVERGDEVRVYVPYGSEWYAYLTRRMAERPANTVFFVRALLGKK
jgi:proline dehydrogenase